MAILRKLKNNKVKVCIGTFILVGIIGGFYYFNTKSNSNVEGDISKTMETYTIADNEKVFINGKILPKETKTFLPSTQGEISKLNVSNGKIVNKGDFLYTIKNQSIIDEVENLNSQLSSLRNVNSLDDPSIKTEIIKLESQIKTLNNKAYINITAPFSGKIYFEENQNVESNEGNIMTLQSNDFYMKGQISEQDFQKLQIDDPVSILILSTNNKVTGRISYISDRPSSYDNGINVDSQSPLSYYDIHVSFDNQENLINGFHVQASVEIKDTICKIPSSAILKDANDKPYVFENFDGILKKQIVQVQSVSEEYTVIKSGLDKKDTILRYPTPEMKEGDNINTIDKETN